MALLYQVYDKTFEKKVFFLNIVKNIPNKCTVCKVIIFIIAHDEAYDSICGPIKGGKGRVERN